MIAKIFLVLCIFPMLSAAFEVDAASKVRFEIHRSRESLRGFDQPQLIVRNMPGVVAADPVGDNLYRWKVSISIPLSAPMEGEYVVRKTVVNDSLTVYESFDPSSPDYLLCRITVLPVKTGRTEIDIDMRLRSRRASGSDFHWLAPLLGESFLGARMKDKLDGMLQEFVENYKKEVYASIQR